jgi:predicted ATPase/DNA-binding winged helix-turn-helix (wHTH) protein
MTAMDSRPDEGRILEFGRYQIIPGRREVLADGKPLHVGDRAFAVLLRLIEARGTLVGKDDLLEAVWPGQIVEQNALHAQISALRRAFAAERGLIRTVPGQGYQLTAEVRAGAAATALGESNTVQQWISELIGRDEQLQQVLDLLMRNRLVSLCGPGGIGKTRLAGEAARMLLERSAGKICIAKLAPLSDPHLVPATVASTLGVALAGGAVTPERIAAAIGAQPIVLVLDNCEHVIEACAQLAEAVLQRTPAARILATSREPLRADGEYVYRVPGLDLPEMKAAPDVAMRSGSIRLFLARVRESDPQFVPDAAACSTMASICRRLDGIPLALELAASRAATLGIDALSSLLDDRFRILTAGKRTAMPRHQTLRAALDWSHDLLPEPERVILRRLAVFAGSVPLDLAERIVADNKLTPAEVLEGIGNLVSKSLVMRDRAGLTYRLLETTRAYAREKLSAAGEQEVVARRHAQQLRDLFDQAMLDWESLPTTQWLAAYQIYLDDLRAALDWAFSATGEESDAIRLTVAAVPLWFQLSLIDECRARVEEALKRVAAAEHVSDARVMQLHAAHGWSLMYTTGPARETGEAWNTALQLAERLGSTDYRLRAMWGLWAGSINNGQFTEALELARRFRQVAETAPDRADTLVGERMIAQSLHFLGEQQDALVSIERMLRDYDAPRRRSHVVRFQFDQRVTARITLSRVLWLRGKTDQAVRNVETGIQEALSLGHGLSLGNVLAQAACPVTLLAGELDRAERYIAMFMEQAAANTLDVWRIYGRCFRGMLRIRRGDVAGGLAELGEAITELRRAKFVQYLTAFLLAQAEGLAEAKRVEPALLAIHEALARVEQAKERWCLAEALRIRGELALQIGSQSDAESYFRQALKWAHTQGALSWELRAATSLARLYKTQQRPAPGRAVLEPVLETFTEGLDSPDVTWAAALLRSLQ